MSTGKAMLILPIIRAQEILSTNQCFEILHIFTDQSLTPGNQKLFNLGLGLWFGLRLGLWLLKFRVKVSNVPSYLSSKSNGSSILGNS